MPRSRRRSTRRRPAGIRVADLLPQRQLRVADPTADAPAVSYEGNTWLPYADLEDVFTPLPLDAEGKPIQPPQHEWREDPRSVKGWNEVGQGGGTGTTDEADSLGV